MKKKATDMWERPVVKHSGFPAEQVLRLSLDQQAPLSDAHVVHISERAHELAKGTKVISVVADAEELDSKKAETLKNRLEWEARQLCKPVQVQSQVRSSSYIQVVKK